MNMLVIRKKCKHHRFIRVIGPKSLVPFKLSKAYWKLKGSNIHAYFFWRGIAVDICYNVITFIKLSCLVVQLENEFVWLPVHFNNQRAARNLHSADLNLISLSCICTLCMFEPRYINRSELWWPLYKRQFLIKLPCMFILILTDYF